MDFGMPTLIEYQTLRENTELCSQLGLSFVELNMNLPYCQISELKRKNELQALSTEYGCYYTIHLDENLDPFCFNPLVAHAWCQTALDAADAALSLGVPIINIHLLKGVYFTLPDRKEFLYHTHRDVYLMSVIRFRDALSAKLSGSGITVCIENTDCYTDFQREAIDLLLEREQFALTWDVGHSFCTSEMDTDYIIHTHGLHLRHMHLHDASGKSAHLPLGTGELALKERLAVAAEHNCRCVIEVKTAESLMRSAEYLRNNLLEF